jgi:hypothetical protein
MELVCKYLVGPVSNYIQLKWLNGQVMSIVWAINILKGMMENNITGKMHVRKPRER